MVNDNMRITDPKVLEKVGQKIKKMYTPTTMQAEKSALMKVSTKKYKHSINIFFSSSILLSRKTLYRLLL